MTLEEITGKRRCARQAYSDIITFCMNPPSPVKTMLGVSVNISESGMCMFAFEHLREGATIEIKSPLPVPHNKATVKWVDADFRTMCKVGLMFAG